MTDSEVVRELKTIRTLIALDKEEKLADIFSEIDDIQHDITNELSPTEWRKASEFKSDIADMHDTSNKTVERRLDSLIDHSLVERKGKGAGTKYRLTGLYDAAELVLEK